MINLIHTGDIHLGRKFTKLGEKANDQRRVLRETFARIVEQAGDPKINLLLIAGDLFDSNQVSESEILFFKEQLEILAQNQKPVCLISGTHDVMDSQAIFNRPEFHENYPNLVIFNPNKTEQIFPELDLTVYGVSPTAKTGITDPLKNIKINNQTKYHIALVHSSLAIPEKHNPDDFPVAIESIANSKMNYIAFGHWHKAQDISQGRVTAWYCGTPESLDFDEQGGKILQVSINEKEVSVKPIEVGQRKFDQMEIRITPDLTLEKLTKEITKGANENLVRQVILIGWSDKSELNFNEILEHARTKFFHLVIYDQTQAESGDININAYPEELITGQYARLIKSQLDKETDPTQKRILSKALAKGLALLEGKNVH